eukprot:2886621-Rhodomonas_salina.1
MPRVSVTPIYTPTPTHPASSSRVCQVQSQPSPSHTHTSRLSNGCHVTVEPIKGRRPRPPTLE